MVSQPLSINTGRSVSPTNYWSTIRVNLASRLLIRRVNAMGRAAIGGVNAVGLVAVGGVMATGLVAIGGVNAMGLVAVGGVNARGLFTYTWWSRHKSNLRSKPAGAPGDAGAPRRV